MVDDVMSPFAVRPQPSLWRDIRVSPIDARLNPSRPLDETVDDLLLAGLLEGDGEFVAVDLDDMAVAELLVKHAIVQRELRHRAGGFRDQFALDGQRRALLGGKASTKT